MARRKEEAKNRCFPKQCISSTGRENTYLLCEKLRTGSKDVRFVKIYLDIFLISLKEVLIVYKLYSDFSVLCKLVVFKILG